MELIRKHPFSRTRHLALIAPLVALAAALWGAAASAQVVTIQENTPGFCSVQGTVDSNHSGFTGSGFANANNAVGAGVDWSVNVSAGGVYQLEWRFANASSDRPGSVKINGATVTTVGFPSTGMWNSWTAVSTTVSLNAGRNSVRLEATTSAGLANIDSLAVTGGGTVQAGACDNTGGGIFRPRYILGADISWTLEQESIGRRYSDGGQFKSVERILVDHGFNYIRIRTFVCPQCPGGYLDHLYSGAGPTENWADTAHTIKLAKRVKTCGMGVFLDFHLSDNWASIGHQERPSQWQGMSDAQIRTAAYNYSKGVLDQMVAAGVKPDMVQCGNENNSHVAGYSTSNWAGFSGVMNSCFRAVRDTDRNIITVTQHGRPRPDGGFPDWLTKMFGSNPAIDADVVCGSTYGTTNNGADWRDMFTSVINNWRKPVMSCEYTNQRRDLVNNTFRNLPNNMGWGTFIWEPTAYSDDKPFNFSNNVYSTNSAMDQYARIAREAGLPVPSKPASQLQGTTCQ